MMRTEFDRKLKKVQDQVRELARIDQQTFAAVRGCLEQENLQPLEDTELTVRKVRALYKDVDRETLLLILREQPVASDLRTIALMQGVSLDLARIGRQLRELARLLKQSDLAAAGTLIGSMAQESSELLDQAIQAVFDRSVPEARQVIAGDDEIDRMFESIRSTLVAAESRGSMQDSVNLLMEAKYLERIADHAVAMAEKLISIES